MSNEEPDQYAEFKVSFDEEWRLIQEQKDEFLSMLKKKKDEKERLEQQDD